MRGGVSVIDVHRYKPEVSSPHAWGCFRLAEREIERCSVFPTCVGVFLPYSIPYRQGEGLPHMRGGVSILR